MTYTWEQLVKKALPWKEVTKEDVLEYLKEGVGYALFLKPKLGLVDVEDVAEVERIDPDDTYSPVGTATSWLTLDSYKAEWVVVCYSVLEPPFGESDKKGLSDNPSCPMKYTWEQLVGKAIHSTDVRSSFVLDQLKKERHYALFMRPKQQEVGLQDATTVIGVNRDDNLCPIRTTSTWLPLNSYGTDWVVVYKHLFAPPAPISNNTTIDPIKEEKEMTTTTRRVIQINLIDNDAGLDVQHSLVASYPNVITEDDDATTIQELIMNHSVGKKLKAHNEIRCSQVDLDVLKRTGNTVNLLPVKLKDLTWVVK